MPKAPKALSGHPSTYDRRVRNLIFGRLALIFLVFIVGVLWIATYTTDPLRAIPQRVFALFLIAVAFSVLYLVWLRFGPSKIQQIRVQFLVDAFLITWLVWETGDLTSPYVTFYIFLICAAGFYLRKNDVILAAVLCAFCFAALSSLTSQSLIFSFSGEVAPSRAVQIILINVGAFLLVGLLAARLAEKRPLAEELRRAEEEFADLNVLHERILSSVNSGLITTDLQGRIRAFNRAAEETSGLAAKDAIGQSVFSVFGDEIRAPIEMCLGGVQNVEFSPRSFEAAMLEPSSNGNRRRITVACSVSPLIGRSGGVTGLIIAFQDKTELHAMEESLRRADRLSAVGRMAAGLAHEIRNPLGSISSAVQFLLSKNSNSGENNELMNVVVRESDRLNNIISDFLAYARPEGAVGVTARIEDVDVRKTIEDCIALLKHDPSVTEEHRFEIDGPHKLVIRADEAQMKQVCWNLLKNAVQATSGGGNISVEISEPTANLVRLVFRDDGCGIGRDKVSNIFEPFQSGARGTGLGLSIVHSIVTQSGGQIDIESEKEIGTKITIELPKDNGETFDR